MNQNTLLNLQEWLIPSRTRADETRRSNLQIFKEKRKELRTAPGKRAAGPRPVRLQR
jgi:hypothetical protein